jgi:hypothetical protein
LLGRRSFAVVGVSVPALAKNCKDGAPTVLVAHYKSKAWATRPLSSAG